MEKSLLRSAIFEFFGCFTIIVLGSMSKIALHDPLSLNDHKTI